MKEVDLRKNEEIFNTLLINRINYFFNLAKKMEACGFSIWMYPEFDDFPPKSKALEIVNRYWVRQVKERKGGSRWDKKTKELVDNKEKQFCEVLFSTNNSSELIEALNILDFVVKTTRFPLKSFDKIRVDTEEDFAALEVYIVEYLIALTILLRNKEHKNFLESFHILEEVAMAISNKAYELIGYWTGRMEQRRKARGSASARTRARERNIHILKKLRDKHEGTTKQLIREAMIRFDVTEKTIQNYLKELSQRESK